MPHYFYINYIRFISNFSTACVKTLYFITFVSKSFRSTTKATINFQDLGDSIYSKKLLENEIVIDGVQLYLPDYIYESSLQDDFAKKSDVIQLWDLGGLPIHSEKSIHSFDWLYDLGSTNSTMARRVAISWILEWIARYGSGKGPCWSIEIASKRAISLVENGKLFYVPPFGGDMPYDLIVEKINRVLSRTLLLLKYAKYISFRNRDQFFLRSAIFYCEYYRGANSRTLSILLQSVGRMTKRIINKSGEIESRNPEELLEIFSYMERLRNYGQQLNLYGVSEGSLIDISIMRAARTLKALRFENGRLVNAMGSGGGSEPFLSMLSSVDYPREVIKDGIYMGFCMMKSNSIKLIVDVKNPPKSDRTGNAHSGLLSFEFSSGLRKIIVNCGSGHRHDSYIQRQNRSTYAHSTLEVSDHSQAIFLPVWPRSLRPQDRMVPVTKKKTNVFMDFDNNNKILIAEHSCYEKWFGLNHKREFKLAANGHYLLGSDKLVSCNSENKEIPFRVYFHLHPDVEVWHLETNKSIILKLKNGETWIFTHKGGDVFLAESSYFGRGNLLARKSKQIVVSSNKTKYTNTIEWSFHNQISGSGNLRDIGLENLA